MKSPLAVSLLRSRTRFVEAKTMIVQRLDMTVCRRRPPEHSAAVISWGSVPDKRWSSGTGTLCDS